MSNLAQFFAGGSSGYPFLFPSLFGGGGDGALTLTTSADVGYRTYGIKQATSAGLAAGQTLTVATGASSGAFLFACSGTLTIAGSIVANGQAGGNGDGVTSGTGGGAAGGGAQTAGRGTDGDGTETNATVGGAYIGLPVASIAASGGSGAFRNTAANSTGGGGADGRYDSAAALNINYGQLLAPSTVMRVGYGMITGASQSRAASGTGATTRNANANYGPWFSSPLNLLALQGGAGGGGGGVTGAGAQTATGGGGGGGGGVVYIEANNLVLTAGYSITANGGNGGNGYSSNGTTAVGAAGGAGNGGLVIIVYRTLTGSTAAITANAGSTGAGAGTGAYNGLAALAGGVFLIKV